MKKLIRRRKLECVDAGGNSKRYDGTACRQEGQVRIVTNSENIAHEVKTCKIVKIRNHRDGWSNIWKSWKTSSIVMDSSLLWKQKLCRAIVDGFMKHCKQTCVAHDSDQEEELNVTDKELLWSAVRPSRDEELKYLKGLGVYEKVDEQTATAKYGVSPADVKWLDTDKAFEEPMQVTLRTVALEFRSGDRPDLNAWTPPLEGFKTILSNARNHWRTIGLMHIGVSRAYFRDKAKRTVLMRLPMDHHRKTGAGIFGLLNKGMYGTRDAEATGSVIGNKTLNGLFMPAWSSARRTCFDMKGTEFQE